MSKMWLDKEQTSNWATSYYIINSNFGSEKYDFTNLIKDPLDAYRYCRFVEDDPKVRKNITNTKNACSYCLNIKDRPEIRKYITKPIDCYFYCKYVKHDKKLAKIAREDGYNI